MPSIARSPIQIASRESPLALWQTRHVAQLLQCHGLDTEIKGVTTIGDRVQDRFIHEIGGKGVFIKELEQSLLKGEAHLAVHSMKDMPVRLHESFQLGAILNRHGSGDLLIVRNKSSLGSHLQKRIKLRSSAKNNAPLEPDDLDGLPCFVGTGSLRRQYLFKKFTPQITCIGVRGNINTRLKKLQNQEYEKNIDALVLAQASLERMGDELEKEGLLRGLTSYLIGPHWFVPSAAQGALGVELLANSKDTQKLMEAVAPLNHPETREAITLERKILELLGGDCRLPFGCHVQRHSQSFEVQATVLNDRGKSASFHDEIGPSSLQDMARKVINGLKSQGVNEILAHLGLPQIL